MSALCLSLVSTHGFSTLFATRPRLMLKIHLLAEKDVINTFDFVQSPIWLTSTVSVEVGSMQ